MVFLEVLVDRRRLVVRGVVDEQDDLAEPLGQDVGKPYELLAVAARLGPHDAHGALYDGYEQRDRAAGPRRREPGGGSRWRLAP